MNIKDFMRKFDTLFLNCKLISNNNKFTLSFKMNEFELTKLPPEFDCETIPILKALSNASRSLGQLKGEVTKIPNAGILLDTLILQEAKDSNEIENIVTTDDEIYQASVDEPVATLTAKEALNYANAIKYGWDQIKAKGFLTTNDIVKTQSIISPNHPIRKLPGTSLKNSKTNEIIYVPPQNPKTISKLLSNLDKYWNDADFHKIDSLIKMPIIHYQFESIHPFYDGNGRTGRLLNILFLVQQGLIDIPVLYLSSYIIKNKDSYYELLQKVRTHDSWEEWIIWMLKGVEKTSNETIIVVNEIKKLIDEYKRVIKNDFSFYSHDLINILFKHPYTKIDFIERELHIHRKTAANYLNSLAESGLLIKTKRGKSNYYINEALLNILKNR